MIIYEYQHLAHKMYFSIWWNTRELVLKTDTFSDSNIIRVVKKNSLKKSYKRCWSQTFLILEFLELLILWVFFFKFFYHKTWLHEKYKRIWVIHSRNATEGNYYIRRHKGICLHIQITLPGSASFLKDLRKIITNW